MELSTLKVAIANTVRLNEAYLMIYQIKYDLIILEDTNPTITSVSIICATKKIADQVQSTLFATRLIEPSIKPGNPSLQVLSALLGVDEVVQGIGLTDYDDVRGIKLTALPGFTHSTQRNRQETTTDGEPYFPGDAWASHDRNLFAL
jgi:hypothetical protein